MDFSPLTTKVSDEQFAELCRRNPELRIERTSEGDLIIMPPTGGKTGARNFYLTAKFGSWVQSDGTGKGFDSSTEFTLPNTAKRSPDVSWIRNERWNALSDQDREEFPPLCPDFVIELRSRSDRIKALQHKMTEYIANGAELGWLIDPFDQKIYVYRCGKPVEILDNPKEISGEPLLKGFVLDVQSLWTAAD
jgi:Uma2 family endonuclease